MSGTREVAEEDASLELDQRLSGDLAALSDFARELGQLGSHPADEPHSTEPRGDEGQQRGSRPSRLGRINADPESVEQGPARLVLALIDLLQGLLEKRAVRRMEIGSLTEEESERMARRSRSASGRWVN